MVMESNAGVRWIVGILAVVAIIALIALARGEPDRLPRAGSQPMGAELRI
jgi:hypothetical protein